MLSCEVHRHKCIIERQKGEDLFHSNLPSGDIGSDSPAVQKSNIRVCCFPHGVAYKVSYVRFLLVISYQINGSFTDHPGELLLYLAIICLNNLRCFFIIRTAFINDYLLEPFFFRVLKDPAGIRIDS